MNHRYDPRIHNRQSKRLKGYDYAQKGYYFITLNCRNRMHLFGEIENKEMKLSAIGTIIQEEWLNTPNVRQNIRLHEFVVMPDHFHGIIEILYSIGNNDKHIGEFKSPSNTLGSVIRGFKVAVAKRVKDLFKSKSKYKLPPMQEVFVNNTVKLWQRDYHDVIIRNSQAFFNISNYIKNNPKNWKE